jgi:hypothetical protein
MSAVESKPRRIKVLIYDNQLQWMDRIGQTLGQNRQQVFRSCVQQFIGEFVSDTGYHRMSEPNKRSWLESAGAV